MRLEIELAPGVVEPEAVAHKVAYHLREALGLTIAVQVVARDVLPRFEMKASRFVVEG
jgi:phenylacetate-coenzyme A ligase PaaK-like adenylate-forming protein